PVPPKGGFTVMNAANVCALHAQPACVLIATLRVPPALGTESLVGESEYEHGVVVVDVDEVVDGGVGNGAFASFRSIVIELKAVSRFGEHGLFVVPTAPPVQFRFTAEIVPLNSR